MCTQNPRTSGFHRSEVQAWYNNTDANFAIKFQSNELFEGACHSVQCVWLTQGAAKTSNE